MVTDFFPLLCLNSVVSKMWFKAMSLAFLLLYSDIIKKDKDFKFFFLISGLPLRRGPTILSPQLAELSKIIF